MEENIDNEMSFEQAILALNEVVELIDSEKLTLDQSLTAYKRGRNLLDHARSLLAEAEATLVEITLE